MDVSDSPLDLQASKPTGDIDRAIGRQLRLRRELQGVSETQCAELAGILPPQLQNYETGRVRIPASVLAELARVLEAPVSYFFDLVGSGVAEAWISNVITFPVDNSRVPRDASLAEQELLRHFRAIASPQDRELLVQMAERLTGK